MKIVGCSTLAIGSEKYVRGDIIEIPESMFEADLYEKVEPKPMKPKEEPKEEVEPPNFLGIVEEPPVEETPSKPRKKKRKT